METREIWLLVKVKETTDSQDEKFYTTKQLHKYLKHLVGYGLSIVAVKPYVSISDAYRERKSK